MTKSSPTSPPHRAPRFGTRPPIRTLIGFLIAMAAIAMVARLSHGALKDTVGSAQRVTNTLEVTAHLETILSTMKDAETGQRGFVLTGDESYAGPYDNAKATLAAEIATAHALVADDPEQRRRLYVLERLCAEAERIDALGDQSGGAVAGERRLGRPAVEHPRRDADLQCTANERAHRCTARAAGRGPQRRPAQSCLSVSF